MLLGDLTKVARVALTAGVEAIKNVHVTVFVPIKPMLAEMAQDLQEVFKEHKGVTAFEFKYDGARIQIHRRGDRVRIFSRRLTDVTNSLPDIAQLSKDRIKGTEFLIEGEVVAIGEGHKATPVSKI